MNLLHCSRSTVGPTMLLKNGHHNFVDFKPTVFRICYETNLSCIANFSLLMIGPLDPILLLKQLMMRSPRELIFCDLNRKFNHMRNSGIHALNQTIGNCLAQTLPFLSQTKLQAVRDHLLNESIALPCASASFRRY